jgi:GNAT superfamily N-acetyltransferase
MTDRIREARASDRSAIEAVTLSAYEQYGVVMPPALWVRYRENIVTTLAAAPPGTQIVAEEDGRIVAAVLLYPAGARLVSTGGGSMTLTFPEVRLLAVAPSARGQGIGALLMDECVRRARESGAEALTLHTTDMMRAAMQLYERLGFRRMPELDFEPAPGVTVKGFRLDLSPGIAS